MTAKREKTLSKFLNKEQSYEDIKSAFAGLFVAVRDFNGKRGTPVEFIEKNSNDVNIWRAHMLNLEMDICIMEWN